MCKTYLKDLNSDIFYMHQHEISNFVIENSNILTEYFSQLIIFTVHITCLLSCPCVLDSHPCRTTRGTNPALVSPFPLKDKCTLSLTNQERANVLPCRSLDKRGGKWYKLGLYYLPTVEDAVYNFQKGLTVFQ